MGIAFDSEDIRDLGDFVKDECRLGIVVGVVFGPDVRSFVSSAAEDQ